MELPLPNGEGVAHVIAVFPCSTASAEEVALLCERVQPSGVYVDVYPEQVARLRAEVAASTLPEGLHPDSPQAQVRCCCALLCLAWVCVCVCMLGPWAMSNVHVSRV